MKDINTVVEVLNRAFKKDPDAIYSLITNGTSCNQELANDKTIVVTETFVKNGKYIIGFVGLLNGICEELFDKKIASMWETDEYGRKILVGFTVYKKEV